MISFFVPGLPRPGGSKRVFISPKTGKPIVTDMSKNKDWKASVAQAASERTGPMNGPLELYISFIMPRPKSHFKKSGALKDNAPQWHTVKPDATKLTRSTEDALKGIAWHDDSQVCRQTVTKIYGEKIGAQIAVTALEEIKF